MTENITYLVNMLDYTEGKNDIFFEVIECIKNQIDNVGII